MGDRTEQTGWERTTVLKAEKQKYLFLIFKKQAFYRIIGAAGFEPTAFCAQGRIAVRRFA
jgi:hypothetical protein